MNIEELKKPFPIEKISWRVGATTKDKTKAIPLAYIDARDVMERLDDVVGMENWQDRYPYKGCCEIGIRIDGEWVWKSNGAGETQVEADKGQYSDAFKRAGVLWGIGRYLYDVPNIWVEIDQYRKIKNPSDPRLEGALKKAEAIARGEKASVRQAAPQKSPKEKKEAALSWSAQQKALINSLNDEGSLRSWIASVSTPMERLQDNYPDVHKDLEVAYTERLTAVKEQ